MWLLVIFPLLTGALGMSEDCENATLCDHLPWSEWSACSQTCGGGYQIRKRKICGLERWDEEALKEYCGNPLRIDIKICNMDCLNNGSFVNGNCMCTPRSGKTGRCCEKDLLSLENLMTSKEIASTFLRNRAPRTKRDIYEECEESGSCDYEEVREWIEDIHDRRGVCEWMKDKRCAERGCRAGYTCVTIVQNCYHLSSYEIGCQDINECASNPCINGGTCHNLINRYTCSCSPGYYGTHCEHDINECASYPCINGGTCHNLINRYICSCQPGYYGTRCEHDINVCKHSPCMHGGVCHNLINRYTCSCQPGYRGKHCQYDINECASNPCLHGGLCDNLINRYACSCQPGHLGTRCEVDINECVSHPCINGGTCHNLINRYTCSCQPGYYGTRCEHDINECASNPCINGGTCHNLINRYVCSCQPGYYGTRCELDKDECASNPCMHGGTCHDWINEFTCSCHDGYQGPRCERDINECASNPCYNDGTCHDLRNNFTCSCQDGYYGPLCELECTRPDYCDESRCTTEVDFICIKCYGQGKTPEDSIYFTSSDQKKCTDQSPPKFTNCPAEMVQKYDSGKGSYVNWEPIHVEENIGNFSLSSNVQNGAFFSFGDHPVVYSAVDNSGNAKNCSFIVRVIEIKDKACTAPPVPFHGFLGCQNKGALQCSIHSCDDGYLLKNNDLHTCENGVWNPEFPKDFIATSCIKPEPTYLRRNYTFTFNCPNHMINASELRDCIYQSGLCPERDILLCDRPFHKIGGQQLSSKILQIWMIMEKKMSVDTNKQVLVQQMDDHGQKIADLFQRGMFLKTCSNLTCDFEEMSDEQIPEVCAEGSTFYKVNGHLVCAKCGPGWFYAENTCSQCPKGFYQDKAGQQDCKKCPDERTSTIGAFSISQCFAKESRELLSPFDTTTAVGGALGGLFVLVLLLIVLIVIMQWRRSSLECLTSANKSKCPKPVYDVWEKKSSLDS